MASDYHFGIFKLFSASFLSAHPGIWNLKEVKPTGILSILTI